MKKLFEIFFTSAKVGALTFGGGYAMLPILQKEVVEKKKWNTEEEILEYYALSQCLPGIIMVNTLIFVGQKQQKKAGAVISGIGAVTPSLIIILLIASLLTAFADVPLIQNAFAGIRVCVCVLIFNSIMKLWKSSIIDAVSFLLFLITIVGSLALNVSPIIFVVGAGVVGIAATYIARKRKK